jgi:hypothetical protein
VGLSYLLGTSRPNAPTSRYYGIALSLVVASILTFSLVRQEIVLFFYPTLFSLPGAAFGATVARKVTNYKAAPTAREATCTCADEIAASHSPNS